MTPKEPFTMIEQDDILGISDEGFHLHRYTAVWLQDGSWYCSCGDSGEPEKDWDMSSDDIQV